MGRVDGRVAVVTGGGSGIGAALVSLLTAEGATVVAVDRDDAALASVAAATGCATSQVGVSDPDANTALMGGVVADHGGLDLVFLNAGILGRAITDQSGPPADLAALAANYRSVLAVNLDGVVHGTIAAAAAMTGGAIVATASVAGLMPWVPDPVYTVSKHGVVGWVRAIAPALAEQNITINAICPGGVATPLAGMAADAAEGNEWLLHPRQVAEAMLTTALESETGRAVSVVAGRDPVRQEHHFTPVPGM